MDSSKLNGGSLNGDSCKTVGTRDGPSYRKADGTIEGAVDGIVEGSYDGIFDDGMMEGS